MAQYLDHARVNADWPERSAQCQRCGNVHTLADLSPQYAWAGLTFYNTNYYVCQRCLDIPAPFQRTIILPPDPPPTFLARQINFPAAEKSVITSEDGIPIVTEGGGADNIVPEGH